MGKEKEILAMMSQKAPTIIQAGKDAVIIPNFSNVDNTVTRKNSLTTGKILKVDTDGKFADSGLTETSGVLTHSTDQASADTEYIPMVLYNTDDTPPSASNYPVGTIYLKYTP